MNPTPALPSSPLAVVYGRLSKGDDALESHEARNLKYVEQRGFQLLSKYEDADTSGEKPIMERPGGRAMINRLRLGDVRHLVIVKMDRLGRSTIDCLRFFKELKELDVSLHIVDFNGDSFSTMGAFGKVILTIMIALAEWELDMIRERTRKMAEYKFERDELGGTVPFGFDCVYRFADGFEQTVAVALSNAPKKKCKPGEPEPPPAPPSEFAIAESLHGRCRSKTIVDNPVEQQWIRRMAAWRGLPLRLDRGEGRGEVSIPSAPRLSLKAIADRLNAAGVRSKAGGLWQTGNVDGVLKSKYTRRLLQTPEHFKQAA